MPIGTSLAPYHALEEGKEFGGEIVDVDAAGARGTVADHAISARAQARARSAGPAWRSACTASTLQVVAAAWPLPTVRGAWKCRVWAAAVACEAGACSSVVVMCLLRMVQRKRLKKSAPRGAFLFSGQAAYCSTKARSTT